MAKHAICFKLCLPCLCIDLLLTFITRHRQNLKIDAEIIKNRDQLSQDIGISLDSCLLKLNHIGKREATLENAGQNSAVNRDRHIKVLHWLVDFER